MTTPNKAVDEAIINLASLIMKSAKDKKLVIEFKNIVPPGNLDNGVNANNLLNELSASLGMISYLNTNKAVPHINEVPIPIDIFPDVMKAIGQGYLT